MAEWHVAPYGAWQSPITSDLIVGETIGLGQIRLDAEDTYWLELRPGEGGRSVVVQRLQDGTLQDRSPAGVDVRTRVHEYGGGAYTTDAGTLYFVDFTDGQIYRQDHGEEPRRLTQTQGMRYADLLVDGPRGRLIAVREDHSGSGQAVATIVGISTADGAERVLAKGHDFFASPRLSPDGAQLAWLAWDHPNMPWDGTWLYQAGIGEMGTAEGTAMVAGGLEESIFQPEWSPDGTLYFVSDRSGWWNLYRLIEEWPEPLCPRQAEFGEPQWVFGMSLYAFLNSDSIACAYTAEGLWTLAVLDTRSGGLREVETPYTEFQQVRASAGRLVFLGASPLTPTAVVSCDPAGGACTEFRAASTLAIDAGYLSAPRPVTFPTEGGQTAHAFYYPPRNRDAAPPAGELPPLIVTCHGGPTSSASAALSLNLQYWTSRGFALLDVDYGGSSGYGRPYRERLNGGWGIVDVDDCVAAAHYLVEQGLADPARLAITGGSAGGYTTLCAITFRTLFAAATSYYGVSDAEALARDTHKFESRYLDRLIGPYPEAQALYRERSPIHYPERISAALLLLQGLDDRVVPPSQSEEMYRAVEAKGLPVAYLAFTGEQHGFRQAANIKRSLEAELYFYGRVFGFSPGDTLESVPIANLHGA